MNIRTNLFFYFLFLVFFCTGYTQEPIYKHFGVDEGLPSSQVYDIYQAKDGYIWFATDKGLSRYNGYEFENFDTNDGLPGNVVLRFYPQKNGEVWAYSLHAKSFFYFDNFFNGFTHYTYNKLLQKELNPYSIVKSLFIDNFKTMQIGGVNINGILSIKENGKFFREYTHKTYFDGSRPQKYIALNQSPKGEELYFSTVDKSIVNRVFVKTKNSPNSSHVAVAWFKPGKKAVFMDGNSVEIINDKKEVKVIEAKNSAIGIKVIDSTHFFVGYYFGGGKIITDKGKVVKEFLKEKSVTNFLIDHEGGYWFTTLNSGVYYVKNPLIKVLKTSRVKKSSHIKSLVKSKNKLLVGYKNGDFTKITINNTFKIETKTAGNTTTNTTTLVEYDAISDVVYVYDNQELKANNVFVESLYSLKLSEPSSNGTVFSSGPFGFLEINKNKKRLHLLPKRVLDVCANKKDTLLATPLGVFKKKDKTCEDLTGISKLLGYRSDDIDFSEKIDCFFIATQGTGVVVYGQDIYNISKKDGLTSNIVNEIHIENDSTIWACTNKGLNRIVFNDKDFTIDVIDKNAGLLSNEVEDIEIINDTLWMGTKDGLCYLPKKTLDLKKLDSMYFHLKEVKVNDVIYNFEEKNKLNYNENKITFSVQGISYGNHSDLEYRYRLKEIDTKWTNTKNRNISFPNLKDGIYTFQVKTCINNRCYEKNQLEYRFIIRPPFWKSWWFYTLCFLALVGLVYGFFKIRVLTYNKDIVREFIRLLIKGLKRKEKYIQIRMNGESIKVVTNEILFIKSSGNYLDIVTTNKIFTIRCKIGHFIATTPDTLEYLRVHRSYIIRIDKVTGKSKKSVTIKDHIIPVGETYLTQLQNIHF